MPQLVSVRFRFNPKPLWFDPQDKTYTAGTEVLVETERGREVGIIVDPAIEATEKQVSKLKTPLKPVIRELTDLDHEHVQALEEKGQAAMPYFREKVEEYELDIKPVEVQYLFSGERAVFFFSSEERVDFRELVRDLAQHFHVRIDMRQIGARDEAKELGGIAHCGEEFCCTRFGGEFQPVSIRMAKEQDLPLNPSKISGVCGRLMCCLRYEYEAYKDFKKRAPKKGTPVDTPIGDAVISGYNTPSEIMELKLEDGKRINVPLAEMECHKGEGGGCARCSVSHETIERCASRSMLIALGALEQPLRDALSSSGSGLGADSDIELDIDLTDSGQSKRKRRRRSTASAGGAQSESAGAGDGSGSGGKSSGDSRGSRGTKDGASSGSRSGTRSGQRSRRQSQTSQAPGANTSEAKSDGTRKRRRRSTGGTGSASGAATATGDTAGTSARSESSQTRQKGQQGAQTSGKQKRQGGQRGSQQAHQQDSQQGGQQGGQQGNQQGNQQSGQQGSQQGKGAKPRPGQRSSGLRNRQGSSSDSAKSGSQSKHTHSSDGGSASSANARSDDTGSSSGDGRRRRRRHTSNDEGSTT